MDLRGLHKEVSTSERFAVDVWSLAKFTVEVLAQKGGGGLLLEVQSLESFSAAEWVPAVDLERF